MYQQVGLKKKEHLQLTKYKKIDWLKTNYLFIN